jgi:hypothetical protein
MKSRHMKTLIAAVGAGAVILATATVGFATTPNSLPAGTTVKGKLATGTTMVFQGTLDSSPITVTCKKFQASGKVPSGKKPYTVTLAKPPKISSCTDNGGGTDTIKETGTWTLTENKTSPYTMTLTLPKDGATFVSSTLPACIVTAAPNAADPLSGSFDTSTGKVTDTNDSIPTKVSTGCTSGTATVTATIQLSPNPGTPPF